MELIPLHKATKELWFGLFVLCIATFIIGEVQARNVHGEKSQQPGNVEHTTESNRRKAISLSAFKARNSSFDNNSTWINLAAGADDMEQAHAIYFTTNQDFTGFVASLTVYNPTIRRGQMTRSYISVQNGNEGISAGWVVDPWTFGDSKTRFFVYHNGASCPNSECPNGFVSRQDAYLAPGDVLDAGNHMTIKFMKDTTGNWALYTGASATYLSQIGYFPASLFTGLAVKATRAEFGGQVRFINHLRSPPMGNGVFAKDNIPPGQPTPAMMINVNFVQPDGRYYQIDSYNYRLGYLDCYGLGKFMIDDDRFVYGGPGGCSS